MSDVNYFGRSCCLTAECYRAELLSSDNHAKLDERCHRIGEISGVGPLTADAAVATVGNGRVFKNGRQMAAWIGLVPKQATTGRHVKLGRTTRDGNAYLRTLLVQGARSTHKQALAMDPDKATPEQRWIQALNARMVYGKVLVAIANKHARQIWAILAHEVDYDPCASVNQPMQSKAGMNRRSIANPHSIVNALS